MNNNTSSHSSYIDTIKAVGIISIVIGHSSWILPKINFPIGPFVYSYHLMIFFFITGYNFKPQHADFPYNYIGRRIKNTHPLFVLYSFIFILLHNTFLKYHLISHESSTYGFSHILQYSLNAFTYNTSEVLLGAMWFIPVLVFSSILFCFLFSYAQKARYPNGCHILFILASGCLGIYLNSNNINLVYHIQTAILAIPVIYLGYIVKRHWEILNKYVRFTGSIFCIPIMYYMISTPYGIVELASNAIIHPLLFYPVTILGIYFCLGIAKGIHHVPIIKKIFSIIGKNSYHIMALHFFAFKLIDFIYGYINHISGKTIEQFTHSFEFWPVYYIGGILIPLVLVCVAKIVKNCLFSIIPHNRA